MDKSTAFRIYNRARAAARRGQLDEARVNRAFGLMQTKRRTTEYRTSIRACDCPDSVYNGTICKHRIALMMERRAENLRAC
jgi:hypothetical protein